MKLCLAEILFSAVLVRHGARAPKKTFSFNRELWKEQDLVQLTPLGIRQMFELGANLRQKYVKRLISEQFLRGEVEILTTDSPRTLMSAHCLTLGLYPLGTGPSYRGEFALPYGIQPIAIRSESAGNERLLHAYKAATCPRVQQIRDSIANSQEYREHEESQQELFRRINEKLGTEIRTIKEASSLHGSLQCGTVNGHGLPKGLSEENYRELGEVHAWHELNVPLADEEALRLSGSELARRLLAQLRGAVRGEALKLALYVAHDHTLMVLLKILGVQLREIPPVSSSVSIELYEGERINVSYNGKPVDPEYTRLGDLEKQFEKFIVEDFDGMCRIKANLYK